MPPNKKLSDKDLEVFKKWIAGGLLENSGSKAMVSTKPSVDVSLKSAAVGKPEGPLPMPAELALDPVVHTSRNNPLVGLAASPWSPLVAIAAQKQVLIYNTDTLEFLGVLPFTNGQPVDLKFSRNAKLLIAGGGQGAKSGKVVVWDIASGEQIMTVGQEQDTVIAADLSPDQSKVAVGGPSRLVKIYSTSDGELQHKIKKHTDWVTVVAFSPNGEFLASGDRNGGISIWDPDNGQELFTLAGHKAAVTAFAWRDDSKILASASEDGNIRWWDNDGKQAKSWSAHSGGVLSLSFAHDGKMVSCGRDNQVITWSTEGNKIKSLQFDGELPLRTAFSHNGERVIATDFAGHVAVWAAQDAKRLGDLEGNPLLLAERLTRAEKRLADLQAQAKQTNSELKNAEAAAAKARTDVEAANKAVETTKAEQKASEDLVVKLKEEAAKAPQELLTQVFPPPEHEKKLADARAARAKAREATTNALSAIEARKKDLDTAETNLAQAKEKDPAKLVPAAKAEVTKWKAGLAQTDLFRARQSLAALKRELEAYNAFIAEKKSALDKAADPDKSKAESELKTAEAAAKKISTDLSAQEAKVKKLAADFHQIKPTQLSSR